MRCGLTVRRHIGLSATRTILTYHPVRYADNNRRVMLRELYRSNNLPKCQITRLQRIQNSLARAVVKAPKFNFRPISKKNNRHTIQKHSYSGMLTESRMSHICHLAAFV